MATRINFGKYKGFTMEELATAGKYGRSYLAWCMNNLQNPSLRRAAEKALTEFGKITSESALRKLIAVEPDYRDFSGSDIEREIEYELGESETDARYEAKLAECDAQLRADLQAMGCSQQVVAFVMANQFNADLIFSQIKFSSPERQSTFTAIWEKYQESLPLPGHC